MILTFTGTQEGMTREQRRRVTQLMNMRAPHLQEIHHGGCVGADAEFHEIVVDCHLLHLVEVHPSNIFNKQAKLVKADEIGVVHPFEEPLIRNHIMVDQSTHLLATPKEYEEVLRSGTWATIRRAWKQRLITTIILPNGESF